MLLLAFAVHKDAYPKGECREIELVFLSTSQFTSWDVGQVQALRWSRLKNDSEDSSGEHTAAWDVLDSAASVLYNLDMWHVWLGRDWRSKCCRCLDCCLSYDLGRGRMARNFDELVSRLLSAIICLRARRAFPVSSAACGGHFAQSVKVLDNQCLHSCLISRWSSAWKWEHARPFMVVRGAKVWEMESGMLEEQSLPQGWDLQKFWKHWTAFVRTFLSS